MKQSYGTLFWRNLIVPTDFTAESEFGLQVQRRSCHSRPAPLCLWACAQLLCAISAPLNPLSSCNNQGQDLSAVSAISHILAISPLKSLMLFILKSAVSHILSHLILILASSSISFFWRRRQGSKMWCTYVSVMKRWKHSLCADD